jgi:hypothetical protein
VLAVLCTSELQGALIEARAERSGRPIEITASELAKLLDAATSWSRPSAAADTGAGLNQMFGERPDEALEIANNTDYGLSAGVITNDMQKALDLAFGLESGMVHLNDCTVADEPHVPFGGVKNSGFGREGGRFSMEEMTEVKWITMQRGQRGFPM